MGRQLNFGFSGEFDEEVAQPNTEAEQPNAVDAVPAKLAALDPSDYLLDDDEFADEGNSELSLEGLNAEQLAAVEHQGGPLLVVAGAGSGKTRVLTYRVANLVRNRGVSPWSVLAITFTNKAASEMKERVGRLVGGAARSMWVSTFHSACVRMLRRDAQLLGYPKSFTIYDQADALRLTGYVIRDLGFDTKKLPPNSVHAAISAAKNDLVLPHLYDDSDDNPYSRRIKQVYEEYQRRLVAAGAMDFDDLLLQMVRVLEEHPEALSYWQTRFEHVLVDEYQDTNRAQNALVGALAQQHRNVFVVGDADQSIYRFRGADISNILDFEDAFPDARSIKLEQNYRSKQRILNAANAVIDNNQGRKPKHLFSDRGEGDKISVYHAVDERDEAAWIVNTLKERRSQRPWSDFAVFYRTNAQSRVLEEAMSSSGIPFKVVGGTRFFDRKEIKDLVAYLRVLSNPQDEVSIKRVINVPRRGVGEAAIARLDAFTKSHDVAFFEALRSSYEAGVSSRAAAGVQSFLGLMDELAQLDDDPHELLSLLIEQTGYRDQLVAENTHESLGRVENIDELLGSAAEYESVEEFLEAVTLVSDTDDIDESSVVMMMTLHTAKGLEFPVVLLAGLEEGVFPHVRALADPFELEEERRLCYVGITRAMDELHITNAQSRMLFGRPQANLPSRFLSEIPESLLSHKHSPHLGRSRANHEDRKSVFGSSPDDGGRVFGGGRPVESKKFRAQSTGAEFLGLVVGDQVVHKIWGPGVVVSTRGSGANAEAEIRFPDRGVKRLLLSMAPVSFADSDS